MSHPVTGSGAGEPQGAADRTGGREGGQAGAGAPRWVGWACVGALAGWALLAATGGGIDPGDGLGGEGPRGAFLALALGAPLAAALILTAWGRPALRSRPTLLTVAATAGLALWSALSIVWAAAPDLAWIEANRMAVSLCALLAGLAAGALLPGAARGLGLGLAAAALLPMGLALGSKIVPALLGAEGDLGRLSTPVGYWNGLALVAVMAVPGLLWLAGGTGRSARTRAGAGAGLALVVVVVLLTYSRGGVMAMAMAAGVTLAFLPGRRDALAALVAGLLGAALPAAHALRDPLLSGDGIPVGLREGAGAGLGWRLAIGLVVAALLAPPLASWAGRIRLDARAARRGAAIGAVCVLIVAGAGLAASDPARGWVDDRVSEFRGVGGDAVANDPGRLVNTGGNQRKGWWGESWRAFRDAPLVGQGAGGFALVHLAERRHGDGSLNTREAHGVVPGVLSGTGLVGILLLAGLVVGTAWGVIRAAGRAGPDIGIPLAILAAFALQSAVDWSWSIPALAVPAFAAAGVVLAAGAPGGAGARPRPWVAGAACALASAAVISAALPWWSGHRVVQGEDALAAGVPRTALERARDARAANPLSPTPLMMMGRAYTALREPARALGAYREATRLQPENPATWRALAIFLGRDPRAPAVWRRVQRLDPQDPEAAQRAG